MILEASAPTRISLLGGGTDIPSFYKEYGGEVISLAINLRTKVTVFVGEDLFQGQHSTFAQDADPNLCWEILKHFNLNSLHHCIVHSQSDAFIGAGLGTSASFAVALTGSLIKHQGLPINRYQIAEIANKLETEKLGWYGGFQDQLAASFGRFNHLSFGNQININPIPNHLTSYMFLTYVGGKRKSKDIQSQYRDLDPSQIERLKAVRNLTLEGLTCLDKPLIFASLMEEAWKLKKSNKSVTTPKIDEIYEYGKKHGALTGKILGAGGAGYFLFMVSPDKREQFKKKLAKKGLEEVDFSPDNQGVDVRIL